MRNLTRCLARVLYHVDLEDLPLKQLVVQSKGPHRGRVSTVGSHHNLRDRNAFTDIHVRPQSCHRGNTLSAVDVRKLQKMKTFDSPSAKSTPSLKEARRTSHPVAPSQPLYRTQDSLSQPLPRKAPPPIDDVTDEVTDDVIANIVALKERVPPTGDTPPVDATPPINDTPPSDDLVVHQNLFAYESKGTETGIGYDDDDVAGVDTRDTVITNDDVSIASGDNTRSSSSSASSRPMRRSFSENLSLRSSPKTVSPDLEQGTFTEFVPSNCNTPPLDNTLVEDPTGGTM